MDDAPLLPRALRASYAVRFGVLPSQSRFRGDDGYPETTGWLTSKIGELDVTVLAAEVGNAMSAGLGVRLRCRLFPHGRSQEVRKAVVAAVERSAWIRSLDSIN